jgi:hypothetical protein
LVSSIQQESSHWTKIFTLDVDPEQSLCPKRTEMQKTEPTDEAMTQTRLTRSGMLDRSGCRDFGDQGLGEPQRSSTTDETHPPTHRKTHPCVVHARCRSKGTRRLAPPHRPATGHAFHTRGGRSLTGSRACRRNERPSAARGCMRAACLVLAGLHAAACWVVQAFPCIRWASGLGPPATSAFVDPVSGGEFRSGCGRIRCECDAMPSQHNGSLSL